MLPVPSYPVPPRASWGPRRPSVLRSHGQGCPGWGHGWRCPVDPAVPPLRAAGPPSLTLRPPGADLGSPRGTQASPHPGSRLGPGKGDLGLGRGGRGGGEKGGTQGALRLSVPPREDVGGPGEPASVLARSRCYAGAPQGPGGHPPAPGASAAAPQPHRRAWSEQRHPLFSDSRCCPPPARDGERRFCGNPFKRKKKKKKVIHSPRGRPAGVAQWFEGRPVNRGGRGWTPGPGTSRGVGVGVGVQEAAGPGSSLLLDVSPSLPPCPFLSESILIY